MSPPEIGFFFHQQMPLRSIKAIWCVPFCCWMLLGSVIIPLFKDILVISTLGLLPQFCKSRACVLLIWLAWSGGTALGCPGYPETQKHGPCLGLCSWTHSECRRLTCFVPCVCSLTLKLHFKECSQGSHLKHGSPWRMEVQRCSPNARWFYNRLWEQGGSSCQFSLGALPVTSLGVVRCY